MGGKKQTKLRSHGPRCSQYCSPGARLRVIVILFFPFLSIFQLLQDEGMLLPESNTMSHRGRAVLCCLVLPACPNPEHTLF